MAEWNDYIHIQFATEYHLQQHAVTEVYRCPTYAVGTLSACTSSAPCKGHLKDSLPYAVNIHVFQ